jgi:hypothetical protein
MPGHTLPVGAAVRRERVFVGALSRPLSASGPCHVFCDSVDVPPFVAPSRCQVAGEICAAAGPPLRRMPDSPLGAVKLISALFCTSVAIT